MYAFMISREQAREFAAACTEQIIKEIAESENQEKELIYNENQQKSIAE